MASGPVDIRVPIWPSLVFLLWTCLGIVAFVMQSAADLVEVAKVDPYQAKIWAEMPTWAWTAYAIAVGAGLAGAVALVFRLKAAVWLSALCLIAVLAQFAYSFFLTDMIAVKGWATALFPAFIIAMAIAQLAYARSLSARGLLR